MVQWTLFVGVRMAAGLAGAWTWRSIRRRPAATMVVLAARLRAFRRIEIEAEALLKAETE